MAVLMQFSVPRYPALNPMLKPWLQTTAKARGGLRRGMTLAAVLLAASFAAEISAQSARSEYDVKAAFLFNFSQFVEWPASALANTNAPFIIGILGNDPFAGFLDDLVRNERAYGKPMVVQRFRRAEDAQGAHILFISRSEQARTESILETVSGKPILTVVETNRRPDTRRNGVIGLVTEGGKVRLRVDLDAARSANLVISTKLLRVAEILRTENP
jgi:hypothetical protein